MNNIMENKKMSGSFFESAFTGENKVQTFEDFMKWFESKKTKNRFKVNRIAFNDLKQWSFDLKTSNLSHASGKFFTIEGISIQTNFGPVNTWEQPIIIQPEIGILGIITKIIDGTRHFLMQAKMEPGNVNILQLSPTLQATKSNYTQVHKGNLPPYLEYFIDRTKSKILVDQLLSEQGARFLKKRNRNMIVEVNHNIDVLDDFCWLTLHDIKKLILIDNFVNMDSRSVLSILNIINYEEIAHSILKKEGLVKPNDLQVDGYNKDVIVSMIEQKRTWKSMNSLISWYTYLRTNYELHTKQKPLSQVKDWLIEDDIIQHKTHSYFSVIAVSVEAGTREVTSWTQPLLAETKIGMIGFLTTKINGILHYLIQGKVEPGNFDIIEIAPTISCSDINRLSNKQSFLNYFLNASSSQIKYSTIQSEEGGRFYHFQNRNMIIEISEIDFKNIPDNFNWMTLAQIRDFQRFGLLNIEARNIISFINLL